MYIGRDSGKVFKERQMGKDLVININWLNAIIKFTLFTLFSPFVITYFICAAITVVLYKILDALDEAVPTKNWVWVETKD